MSKARRATVRVLYDGTDISAHIGPFVTRVTYTDQADGKADSVSIELEDSANLWKGGWYPSKGASLKAWIDCHDWGGPGQDSTLFCGTFEVDKLSFSGAGQGDRFTIKGISAKVKNALRGERRYATWENWTLEGVLKDIASTADMDTVFDADPVNIDREDQKGESDLSFLKRMAKRHGLKFKVAETKLVMFDEAKYDAADSVMTLSRGSSGIGSVRLNDSAADLYRACTVSYHDAAADEDLTYTFTPDSAPSTGKTLQVRKRVKSVAEAMTLAKKTLRNKNKTECTGSVSYLGDPRLRAGCVIDLDGYGSFDTDYFIQTATHSVDRNGGYSTECEVRKTLGY